MYKVFDIHTHVYPNAIAAKAVTNLGAFYEMPIEGNGTYEELESDGKSFDICGFLIFAVATNAHQVTKVNDSISAAVKLSRAHGFETHGFGGIHQDCDNFKAEIDRMISLGLEGVKIHPDIQGVNIDDERLLKLYSYIEDKIPLYLHMGDWRDEYKFSKAERLVKVTKMFPKLRVVAAHFGSYRDWDNAKILADIPNVWFDSSSCSHIISPKKAKELINVFGSERIMFGSDYPVKLPSNEFEYFMKIELSEKERCDILYNNAKRFLKF